MSVQRYFVNPRSELKWKLDEDGIEVVTYADHVAAIAEAEQRGTCTHKLSHMAYEQGQRDERERIRKAVRESPWIKAYGKGPFGQAILAIIDGETP
jgi:hypothetical protein